MRRSFKAGPNSYDLIDRASDEIITSVLQHEEFGAVFAPPDVDTPPTRQTARAELLEFLNSRGREGCLPLEHAAQSILTLAEKRGHQALMQVARQKLTREEWESFERQPDDLCRSAWTYLEARSTFEDASSYFYATHHRGGGKLFDAFAVELDPDFTLEWSDALAEHLGAAFTNSLELSTECTVSHLEFRPANGEPDGHLIVVRHAGPLSSVEDLRERGQRSRIYYRPASEATLLFLPHLGAIEVSSESRAVRSQLATSFAAAAINQELSNKPLAIKQYDLSRFFSSLSLPYESIENFEIQRAAVVEVEVRPNNFKRRASVKVPLEDDIEKAVVSMFGRNSVFNRAAAITQVVIAVRFQTPGDKRSKTFNITLRDPNRCNLLGNRDETQRGLGFQLLERWGIAKGVVTISDAVDDQLFRLMLSLHDSADDKVAGIYLRRRGFDVERLVEEGLVKRGAPDSSLIIEDDNGGATEIEATLGRSGFVTIPSPDDGRSIQVAIDEVARYDVQRDWLEERLLKVLRPILKTRSIVRLDDDLVGLGTVLIDGSEVPCYLTRRLANPKVLCRLDAMLRGRREAGVGLVLAAGTECPLALGANVVVALLDHVEAGPCGNLVATDSLIAAYRSGRHLALGGTKVNLLKDGTYSATLYIPGKVPLSLGGANQITIFERLIAAHDRDVPAVPTKELLSGMSYRSPSQAFRNWDDIVDVYVGQAGKRGSWQLLP